MGAFFLIKESNNQFEDKVLALFARQHMHQYTKVTVAGYTLYSFAKALVPDKNFVKDNRGNGLYVTGTVIYKGLNYTESIKSIFSDHQQNSLDITALLGSFCLIFTSPGHINILVDSMGVQNIFRNSTGSIISSSFLALCNSTPKLTLNKSAAAEILCTGSLIGPETIVSEISRTQCNETCSFPGLDIRFIAKPGISDQSSVSYHDEIDRQIATLNTYFQQTKTLADTYHADSGITGGHDSRLIMAAARKNWSHTSYHSHYRKVKDEELEIAGKVCEAAGVELKQVHAGYPADMAPEKLNEVMENAFYFFDGNIRMHSYWTEEYNTPAYRKSVLGNARLGVSGIGGEQYRNMEGMFLFKWNYRNFIQYNILLNSGGRAFKTVKDQNQMVDHLQQKINATLGIDPRTTQMNMLLLKRYLNEVFIPARLGMRNNAENKLSFFLSPFIDPYVSFTAYHAIPHLGVAYRFQEKMISRMDPGIAGVTSIYGFNFNEGEPFRLKVKQLLQNFVPNEMAQKRIDSHSKHNNTTLLQQMTVQHPQFADYINHVKALELPIDVDVILKRIDLMPLVAALGFLVKKLNISN